MRSILLTPDSTHLESDSNVSTFWISQYHFVLAPPVGHLILNIANAPLNYTSICCSKELPPSTSKLISPPSAGEKSNCRFQLPLESLYPMWPSDLTWAHRRSSPLPGPSYRSCVIPDSLQHQILLLAFIFCPIFPTLLPLTAQYEFPSHIVDGVFISFDSSS